MCSEQLDAWTGDIGGDYHSRNHRAGLKQRIRLWAQILGDIEPKSILEVGAGTGTNLVALGSITDAVLAAIEPSVAGANALCIARIPCYHGTAQAIPVATRGRDLVFTSGVLIHIPPDELDAALDEIYRVSSRYIACIEYFADEPETKMYHGRDNLLFKRDFGAYWLERSPDLEVVRTGFAWRTTTGLDNLTYWLFQRR